MKIRVLGCYGGQLPGRNNTALLLNGDTLIDAGTVATAVTLGEQQKIRNVLLSHAHADHTGALPFFAVNAASNKGKGINVYGSAFTVAAVKKYLMNGVIWPDFSAINNSGGNKILNYNILKPGKWYKAGRYRVKIVPVKHTIPTHGFILGEGNKYIVYSGDTKNSDAIWKEAKKLGHRLKAVFIEVAFSDKAGSQADSSCHLVPETARAQLKKLGDRVKPKVFAYHMKPVYLDEIKAELKKIKDFKIVALEEKKIYTI